MSNSSVYTQTSAPTLQLTLIFSFTPKLNQSFSDLTLCKRHRNVSTANSHLPVCTLEFGLIFCLICMPFPKSNQYIKYTQYIKCTKGLSPRSFCEIHLKSFEEDLFHMYTQRQTLSTKMLEESNSLFISTLNSNAVVNYYNYCFFVFCFPLFIFCVDVHA